MKELLQKYNIDLKEEQVEKFIKYKELLVKYNNYYNLTSILDEKEIYIKHFVDSILGEKFIEKNSTLIDVGSGGGFPAIPLKIVREDLDITMLEATGKKCEFLNVVIKELDLKNIKVINERAEILAKNQEFRERFDYSTARAVARLNTLCEYTMPFVKKGGFFVAYKGDAEEEIIEAKNAIKVLGGKIFATENYLLEDAKRTIIKIEKIEKTNEKYPRGNGKERKKPL